LVESHVQSSGNRSSQIMSDKAASAVLCAHWTWVWVRQCHFITPHQIFRSPHIINIPHSQPDTTSLPASFYRISQHMLAQYSAVASSRHSHVRRPCVHFQSTE